MDAHVRIQKEQVLTPRELGAAVPGRRRALAPATADHKRPELAGYLGRIIRRGIIHHNHLVAGKCRGT